MLPDDFVSNFDRSDIFMIFNQNNLGWTDICTGPTSYAETLNGYGIIDAKPFFHFKRTGAYNFLADPDTQATANTSIGRRSRINAVGFGKRNNGFVLRCHLQQVLESSGSGPINRLTIRFYHHPIFYLQNTGQHRGLPSSGSAGHFHNTQPAGAGRFERWVITQGRNPEPIGSSYLKYGHVLFRIILFFINGNPGHI
jgi:hypothetical protein